MKSIYNQLSMWIPTNSLESTTHTIDQLLTTQITASQICCKLH